MAILAELGKAYPCRTQGISINIDDEDVMYGGDVVEVYLDCSIDIPTAQAVQCIYDIQKIKEEYPQFVIHYVKVEPQRITIQYSIAPVGAHHSPLAWALVIKIAVVAIIGLIVYLIISYNQRGYLFVQRGSASLTAKHTETDKGISGVRMYVDGNYVGRTDGGSVLAKGLVVGEHRFNGEVLEEYHDPSPIVDMVELNKTKIVTIWYRPIDIPEPTTGWLYAYTKPIAGLIIVDGVEREVAPIAIELDKGDHSIAFGEVEGYIAPEPRLFTIVAGMSTVVTGEYESPEEVPWYEKALKYGLIGGGAILGAALLIPEVIRQISRRGERK